MHVVLAIAGSDSSGCAGVQADIRAIAAGDCHPATVVTCITAQNSLGSFASFPVPAPVVRGQLDAVFAGLPVKAVKSGALGSVEAVRAVADALEQRSLPYVLDPVMATTTGGELAGDDIVAAMRARLFPLSTLVIPNATEAEALTGIPVRNRRDSALSGTALLEAGCRAVLVKGGHLVEDPFVDVLVQPSGVTVFEGELIATANTRGTGCTLASTIATHLARGSSVETAVERSRLELRSAILGGYSLPGGGPVDVFAAWRQPGPVRPSPRRVTAHG